MVADRNAATRPDWTVPVAVACVACGWFLLSSLNTDLGAAQLKFHFYDVPTLIRAPGSIATGPFGDAATRDAWLFSVVCVVALGAALAPMFSASNAAWLGCLAPFALMALSGAILYHNFSQDLVADKGVLGDVGVRLSHLANGLADKLGALVTRRIHVGLGGYLALAGSSFLAVKGLLEYRRAT
jgi:hypothetical protein